MRRVSDIYRERGTKVMNAVVGRKARFGRRAWLTAVGAVMLWGSDAIPAAAADSFEAFNAEAGMATLPLLAAMALGIGVAVAAVIAFLQMTTKSRGKTDEHADIAEYGLEEAIFDPHEKERIAEPNDNGDDRLFHTIDVELPDETKRLAPVPQAERAEEGEPRLCGLEGEFAGSAYRITDRVLSIGRDAVQCGLVFPNDAGDVSRKHCSLRYDSERRMFLLEDHGSSNGTFLSDGRRLVPGQKYELLSGDEFTLSGHKHRFEVRD